MKNFWGGEGAESTEELDWETHTEGELKKNNMQKFEPVGRKLLVLPLHEENYKTSVGIELVQLDFLKVKVVEVSTEYRHMYSPGDVLVISKNSGVGQAYNGENCLWIDAKAAPEGDVWFIVREDEV